MKTLTLALALGALLAGHAPNAAAGIVDITYFPSSGQVFLRTDPGLNLLAISMRFEGASGGTFTVAPFADPPNIGPINQEDGVQFSSIGSHWVAVVAQDFPTGFIHTDGATLLVGTLTGAVATGFSCNNCFGFTGFDVLDENSIEIGAQTSYLVPEPKAILLLGLALARLWRLRSVRDSARA